MRKEILQWVAILLGVMLVFTPAGGADSDHCAICGKPFGNTIYTVTDKVTHRKLMVCYDCAICPDECYICGLPVRENITRLADGRCLCARDARTAVLDPQKARETCEEVRDKLDRMFARFMNFPTNATVTLVDRVDLYDDFAVVGNDFECPDVLGFIRSQTNGTGMTHAISLMSALPLAEFQATCAHEYSHAWVFENVPAARRKTLSRDAHEGFCELVAWLLMDSLHEEDQKQKMLRNTYTRGQIDLFIKAEQDYGFNDILDWMRWGVNSRLKLADLRDVRNVEMPRANSGSFTNLFVPGNRLPSEPDTLVLRNISLQPQPLALINDLTLAAGESGKVRVGGTNLLIQCLAITDRSVRVRIVGSGEERELRIKAAR
jgi:hypothetical protein